MSVRTIAILVALALFGGYSAYDYYSPESTKARELRDLEKLNPDFGIPSCFPKDAKDSKVFASTIVADKKSIEGLDAATRYGNIKHDCIRGSGGANVAKLGRLLGAEGVPLYAQVIEQCPASKDEYPVYACFALDALAASNSPAAIPVLEKAYANRKGYKDVALGALLRLTESGRWKGPAELAGLLRTERDWEAKELLIEKIRARRDPAARANLEAVHASDPDEKIKAHTKAALLELDNPGKCVSEDEGVGADGTCFYTCRDQGQHVRDVRKGSTCPLVRDPPGAAEIATSGVVNTK